MRSICYRRQGSRSETLFLVLSKVHKVTPCFMYMIAHDIVHHSSDCDTNELDEPSRSVRNTNANTNTNTHTIIILILLLILALRRIPMGGAGGCMGGGSAAAPQCATRYHSAPPERHTAPQCAKCATARQSTPQCAAVRQSAPQCAKVRHSAPSAPQCATVRQNAFAASPPKPPVPKKRKNPVSQRRGATRDLAASRRHPQSRGVAALRLLAAPPRLAVSRRRGASRIWSPPAQSLEMPEARFRLLFFVFNFRTL